MSLWVYRNPPMPAERVLEVLGVLDAAGVSYRLSGGWGVDALEGEQTRVHRDLDLVVAFADEDRALSALGALGYREDYRLDSDIPTLSRTVLIDPRALVVDLHPVDPTYLHQGAAQGRVGTQTVPCLSASSQLAAHTGYRQGRRGRHDIALLNRRR